MSTDLKLFVKHLRGRKAVSIADLQYAMDCSYVKAKEALQQLRKGGYVSATVQGIHSAVNEQLLARRSMTIEQVRTLVAQMLPMEILMLDIVYNALQRGGYRYDPLQDEDREIANNLQTLDRLRLIHSFEGLVYPSVDEDTWELIRKVDQGKVNEPVLIMLALPVLDKAFALNDEPVTFYHLSLIPEVCKDFVRESFEAFHRTGRKPEILAEKLDISDTYKYSLALDMLKAHLLSKRGLDSVASYARYAELCARKLRSMDLWDDVVYDAADEAIGMLKDMSLEDIRQMQKDLQEDED